jgi:hypothetical protein
MTTLFDAATINVPLTSVLRLTSKIMKLLCMHQQKRTNAFFAVIFSLKITFYGTIGESIKLFLQMHSSANLNAGDISSRRQIVKSILPVPTR